MKQPHLIGNWGGLGLILLSSCVPFDLWSGQSSCQMAVSVPQVTTLSWKPDWEIASVDMNHSGEFFFSPRSDNRPQSEHLRWDALIRVGRDGKQIQIRTGPTVSKIVSYLTTDSSIPFKGDPGEVAVFGLYIWIKDYRNDGQLRFLNTSSVWFHEEIWLAGRPIKTLLWPGHPIYSGAQGQLFAKGGECTIYQVTSDGTKVVHELPQSSVREACPLSGPMAVDANTVFYSIPSRFRPADAAIPVEEWPSIPTDILSQVAETSVSTSRINISHEIYRISNNQFERWAGSTVAGFQDGFQEKATFREPSYLAAARDGTVYVSDTGNHAIRKISPTGEVTTLAGNGAPGTEDGPLEQARLDTPQHILLGPCHRLYVFDKKGVREIALPPGPSAERWGPPVTPSSAQQNAPSPSL